METVSIQTTQNITISYKLAGVTQRIGGFLLDAAIITCFFIVMMLLNTQITGSDTPSVAFSVITGIIAYLYFLLFEILMDGQTPGKKIVGIRVVKLDGSKPSMGAYILRWIMIPVDFSLSGGIAIALIIFTKKGQRLGDLLAGTTVVQVRRVDTTLLKNKMVMDQVEEDYHPTFPDAINLNDQDVKLIHQAITAFRVHSQRKPVTLLKQKMEEKLQIKSDLPPIQFLFTLAKDYTYYSHREL